ncbi:MAG: hypothetical protein O2923_14555 [Verrucomicrobia bacterium]|nr:hypothetical protein [Verrucomicrobiota bacterium]
MGVPMASPFWESRRVFTALVNAVTRDSNRWSLACGAALGVAVGMNIATVYFVPAAALVLLLTRPLRTSIRLLIGLGAGLAILALVFLSFWLPQPVAAMEQFRWFVGVHEKDFSSIRENWVGIMGILGHGKWWIVALIAVWIAALTPLAGFRVWVERDAPARDPETTILLGTVLFAACALALFSFSSMYRYYLAFFTPWPVLGTALLAARVARAGWGQRIVTGLACLTLAAAWIPSLAWNGLKLRENLLFYSKLDAAPARRFLRAPYRDTARLSLIQNTFCFCRTRESTMNPCLGFQPSSRLRFSRTRRS